MAATLALSGCLSLPAADDAVTTAETTPAVEDPAPVVQQVRGRITATAIAPLAHQDPETELLVAPVQREGFILEVVEVPDIMELHLAFESTAPTARMLSMVNIPTSVEGDVLDVFSEWSGTGEVCIRVPMDEVAPGPLSVMAHSADAVDLMYVLTVKTWGGDTVLHEDRGHMEVEREGGEKRDPLPCGGEDADA